MKLKIAEKLTAFFLLVAIVPLAIAVTVPTGRAQERFATSFWKDWQR